jgi:hypothetical protein
MFYKSNCMAVEIFFLDGIDASQILKISELFNGMT